MALRPFTARFLRVFVVLVAVVALLPVGHLAADWVSFVRVVGRPLEPLPPRGFDWVYWTDREGEIVAAYVVPLSPAHEAGLRAGDVLFQLQYQQFFTAEDVKQVVSRASGQALPYEVTRGDEPLVFEVPITRYPTFLYPLSSALQVASAWGFSLAAFLHLLALLTVAPLVLRSKRARRSFVLIGAGLLWVGGNLLRIAVLMLVGPPETVSPAFTAAFDGLTLLSLAGWILFPAFLLRHVLLDASDVRQATRWVRPMIYVAPVMLGVAVLVATVRGTIGPIPPDAFLRPILFYVCCYVAAATGLPLLVPALRRPADEHYPAPPFSRLGSAGILVFALLGALFAYNALPLLATGNDETVAWIILLLQLLSVLPVGLVSVASLRYGRLDTVLSRSLAYLAALGGLFFAFVGGLWLLEALGAPGTADSDVVAGLWMVVLLLIAERLARPLRRMTADLFTTERQRARQRLNRFGDRVRTYLDPERLAHDTVQVVGEALGVRSAVLFLRAGLGTPQERWVQASWRPEPPYFTRAELGRVWSQIQEEGKVWAANAELNESSLAPGDAATLRAVGAALAVPVTGGQGVPVGVFVLGRKVRRRAVYNLEDVEMLRALCGQLALAMERLGLLEREQALVRESAEAHLAALRAQINPHFLFNALNTIAALIGERPEEAESVVEHLAALFRTVLQAGSRTFVPLEEELRLVRQYLAIEQARFGEALQVEEALDDSLATLPVPAFSLQTLVENAVKHGIERKRGGGTVRLSSRRLPDGTAEIAVADTGVGIPALFPAAPVLAGDEEAMALAEDGGIDFFGIGLRNVASRLERLYGRTDLLSFESAPEQGTVARIQIPLAPS
ncbi:MAG TPA: histidine kinase [Rubricoccaceae bacterium]|nr:histidine kinase [Rubricoccaceae bacterium]